jgi:hypothetical protein
MLLDIWAALIEERQGLQRESVAKVMNSRPPPLIGFPQSDPT